MGVKDTFNTINTSIRTFMMVCIAALLGSAGFVTYERFEGERRKLFAAEEALAAATEDLEVANQEITRQAEEIMRLDTAMRLLKVDSRLARIEVLDQTKPEDSEIVKTKIRFIELAPDGEAISDAKEFTIDGDVLYIDNWTVKFEDKFVEEADIARGTSLTLFRRIFGEHQTPNEGFMIDEIGSMPQAYLRGGQPSEFEEEIWSKFWEFANDREKAAEKGIRAAHGEAVSVKTQPGMKYEIQLRASDGLTLKAIGDS